jgi:hypothetical protein
MPAGLPVAIELIVNVLTDVGAQATSSGRESLHVLDMMTTCAAMGVSIGFAAPELDEDVVDTDLVGCDARVAAEIQVALHGEPFHRWLGHNEADTAPSVSGRNPREGSATS